jgi:hypothetical protein
MGDSESLALVGASLRIPPGERAGALLVSAKLQRKKPPLGGFLLCNLAETVGFISPYGSTSLSFDSAPKDAPKMAG